MYLDHLQNWLVYGHGLLIFLILALFWLSEMGQIWGFRAFPGQHMEGMAWNFGYWCILTTYRSDWFRVTVCWFLQFWHYFDLVKRVKFGVSGHFLENPLREWPEMWYATVSWPPSELISLWLRCGDFSNFGAILTKWNGSNLGFLGIFWKTHGEIGLKFCMLMYLDHFHWLNYGYSL